MQIKLSKNLILSVFKPFFICPSFATTLYNNRCPDVTLFCWYSVRENQHFFLLANKSLPLNLFKKIKEFLFHSLAKGYKGFEEVIMDEVSDLKMELGKRKNEPMAVSHKVHVAIMNILWNLACGRKLHAQQQEFQTVVECIDKVTQFMSMAAIFSFMPILTKILPESITNIERGRYYRNRFHEISEKWIREHRQEYRGNRTGDLQDAYLDKVNKGEDTFTEQGLSAILRELFVIGSESESVMMRWAIRILSCNKEVQAKVQQELDKVCGPGVDVTWDKKDQLPYTMAVIKEIQR